MLTRMARGSCGHDTDASAELVHHRCRMTDSTDSDALLIQAARNIERRDAEILLAACVVPDARPIAGARRGSGAADVAARFTASCARRAAGFPVAYLLGRREFWSLTSK